MAPGFTSGFISGAPVPTTVRTALDGDDRVEARAGRVHADPLLDRVQPLFLDDLRHREHFRDRLDRDLGLDVAGGVDLAVDRHDGDAEQVRIDLRQRGNVVGVLAFLEVPELRVGRVHGPLHVTRRLRVQRRARHRQHAEGERAALTEELACILFMAQPPSFQEKLYLNENWILKPSLLNPSEKFSRRPHCSSPPNITFGTGV